MTPFMPSISTPHIAVAYEERNPHEPDVVVEAIVGALHATAT